MYRQVVQRRLKLWLDWVSVHGSGGAGRRSAEWLVVYVQVDKQAGASNTGGNPGAASTQQQHQQKASTSSTASGATATTTNSGSTPASSGNPTTNTNAANSKAQAVLERIRLDCREHQNSTAAGPAAKKLDRCVQLRLSGTGISGTADATSSSVSGSSAQYADSGELTERIVELLHASLVQSLTNLLEELRVVEPQRQLPGFQYCLYFLLKERLAVTLERVGVLDEALAVLDDLESVYHQCVDATLQKGMCIHSS